MHILKARISEGVYKYSLLRVVTFTAFILYCIAWVFIYYNNKDNFEKCVELLNLMQYIFTTCLLYILGKTGLKKVKDGKE